MTQKLTTAGALLIKHSLPTEEAKEHFDLYRPLDKKGMAELVSNLIKRGGPTAPEHINTLTKIFFNKATEIGATTPLSDYINDSDERQAIIAEFESKARLIMQSKKDDRTKNKELGDLTVQYGNRIEKQNLEYLLSKKSTAAKMAQTGARGNPKQLSIATSAPLMSLNLKGELVPVVIKRSFAEGMTPAEHIAMSYMGRASTVAAQLSTALPGALFKRLAPTLFHEVITEVDCGTKNGLIVNVKDANNVKGRYTALTNKLVDEAYYRELTMSGQKTIKMRSVMTCEAHDGVCQHCYGLLGNGKPARIGENVGVIAAQSVSEVLTQAMLSTKHRATVGERKGNSYDQASNLLNNPAENFKDEATISTVNGKVTAIKPTPLGDNHVFVNGTSHFVPRVQELRVSVGEDVKQGQPLSTGVVNPRKLVALRGIGAGREYIAKELRAIYSGGLDPRHFEVIAKNLIKYAEVTDPGETGLLPGEKVDINRVQRFLSKKTGSVPLDEAEGHVLAKGVLSLTPGTLLDGNHIEELREKGITHVDVTGSGLKVKPFVPGLQSAKLLDPNWISKLSFSRLKDTLKESAALGSESPIHSTDPITPYILGTEFGEGEHGKY
ncbi:MAG TPA: hypothetical protein VFM18_05290 [Methanosarcina sp.]|nr:hypothetical protein [Methanosarcina sp.]